MLAMASRIIKDYRSDAFLYLAMGDKPAENGEFPIFVFNYLPYEITTPMPDKNKTNLGLAPVFLIIQRCARVLYV